MAKSADAFRTISEVADWLDTPAHVLRFWESKFSQVKPVKRAGGRRYYRPVDMELLGGIKRLLHDDGMTIKGVQKILREQGIKHVAAMSPMLDDLVAPVDDPDISDVEIEVAEQFEAEAESAEVLQFQRNDANGDAEPDTAIEAAPAETETETEVEPAEADVEPEPALATETSRDTDAPDTEIAADAPAFGHRSSPAAESPAAETPPPEPEPAPAPRPRIIETPPDPTEAMITPTPGLLTRLARRKQPLSPQQSADLAPLVARLSALHEKLAQSRKD